MAIRKRRRDRTQSRMANQKRLDAIVSKELNGDMSSSFDTWGGTRCPNCAKALPSRAFFCGYRTDGQIHISIGSSVSSEFCHVDKTRCHSESAKTDPYIWKLANDYTPTKKELKQLKKEREYRENRALKENLEIHTARA